MTKFLEKLFGTDGIRGEVGVEPFTKNYVRRIAEYSALVLSKVYNNKKFVVGYDTRESGVWISKIFIDIFSKFGYDVYCLDVFTTPGVAYMCQYMRAIGVVISASHNPYNYNGIKFFTPDGEKIPVKLENEIEEVIKNKSRISKIFLSKGKIIDYQDYAEQKYINFLSEKFLEDPTEKLDKKISLVVDCANGATYKIAQKLFKKFFDKVKFLNVSPDGKNINENCGAVYPEKLKSKMSYGDIGITFDGDGDRVIFIDEKKNIRDGDYIVGFLVNKYKEEKKLRNSLVVVTTMSNLGLLKYLWAKNIKVIQCPVGDKYVSEYLKEYKGNLGGEQSGHIVLYEYLHTGDGILTSLEVLRYMLKSGKKLSTQFSLFKKYPQLIKNVKTLEKPPIEKIFSKEYIKNLEHKIQGRIVLRYSGTEPLFRIMVEGLNKDKIKKAAQLVEKEFLRYLRETK
ncbi:MAG: phosphoglucosamine mutase [Endomicrobia bacterium]|nr:phosphoglucosamine mutase [Endomicrobiia bacterium]